MGTVAKALSLLDLFTRSRARIGLSDLARLSGMNKATVHRLMGELQAQGFVEQADSNREYRLGPAFLRLASLREASVPLREVSAQVVRDLSAATGETAHVSLLQGGVLSTIAYAYSPDHGTRVAMDDAEILALHATSSGLAVLAFCAPDFIAEVLAQPLERRTAHTLTEPGKIRALLPGIRAAGIAESIGGFEVDVHSHATPIFDAVGRPIGAIAVAAPTSRMTPALAAKIRTAVLEHGRTLTRILGGFPPEGFATQVAA